MKTPETKKINFIYILITESMTVEDVSLTLHHTYVTPGGFIRRHTSFIPFPFNNSLDLFDRKLLPIRL